MIIHFGMFRLRGSSQSWTEPFTDAMHKLVEAAKNDADMTQLVQCSYYTGMRLSEVFDAKFKTVGGIICFDVASAGGKTKSGKD